MTRNRQAPTSLGAAVCLAALAVPRLAAACSGPGAGAAITMAERSGWLLLGLSAALALAGWLSAPRSPGPRWRRRWPWTLLVLGLHPGWWLTARAGDCGTMRWFGAAGFTLLMGLLLVLVRRWRRPSSGATPHPAVSAPTAKGRSVAALAVLGLAAAATVLLLPAIIPLHRGGGYGHLIAALGDSAQAHFEADRGGADGRSLPPAFPCAGQGWVCAPSRTMCPGDLEAALPAGASLDPGHACWQTLEPPQHLPPWTRLCYRASGHRTTARCELLGIFDGDCDGRATVLSRTLTVQQSEGEGRDGDELEVQVGPTTERQVEPPRTFRRVTPLLAVVGLAVLLALVAVGLDRRRGLRGL